MNSKERMLQYLDLKGISQYNFSKATGLSNGFLKSGTGISSENMGLISKIYGDINLVWLITGEGEMLKENKSKTYAHVVGDGNVVANSSPVANHSSNYQEKEVEKVKPRPLDSKLVVECENLKKKIELLALENQHLKSALESKDKIIEGNERLIHVLMNSEKD